MCEFSFILNELLTKKKLNKTEFSQLIGVNSSTTIANWLNGKTYPSWNMLLKIKENLEIDDIRELFGLKPETEPPSEAEFLKKRIADLETEVQERKDDITYFKDMLKTECGKTGETVRQLEEIGKNIKKLLIPSSESHLEHAPVTAPKTRPDSAAPE